MNCTNCGRPMNTAGLCVYCDECPCGEHGTTNGLRDVYADRQTLALESIAANPDWNLDAVIDCSVTVGEARKLAEAMKGDAT